MALRPTFRVVSLFRVTTRQTMSALPSFITLNEIFSYSLTTKKACFREKGNRLIIYMKRHALSKTGCLFTDQRVSSAARLSLLWTRGFVPPDLSGFTFSETVQFLSSMLYYLIPPPL